MSTTPNAFTDLLGALLLDPWGPDAACIDKAQILENPDLEDEAKAMCLRCPVIDECNDWLMTPGRADPGGVRGGRTETERRTARRRAAAPKPVTVIAKQCSSCGDTKSAGEFNRNRSRGDGLAAECRDCYNARRAANREERAAG